MGRGLAAVAVARQLSAARGVALATCVALLQLAPSARADTDAIGRAAAAFERGLALYQSHDYIGATDEFQASYELDPRPEALFAWAQAARLSDDCLTAIDLYGEFLDGEPRAEDAAAARSAREMCQAQLAERAASADRDEPEIEAPADADELRFDEDGDAGGERAPVDATFESARGSRPARRAPATRSTLRSRARDAAAPAHRWLAYARVDIDASGRGAVVAPGIDLALASGWEVFASGLFGGNRGAEVGARYARTSGRLRPFATAALPVFMVDAGAHPGLRAGVGLRAPFGRDLAVSLEVGGAYALSAPTGAARTVGLVSVGLELAM